MFLTVIIPVYNETKRYERIKKVHKYLKKQKYTSQIVVVNDGSKDNTLQLLKELRKKIPFRIISYEKNMGRGHAVTTAMLKTRSQYKLFMDVDLSTPIETFAQFLPHLKEYGIITGSRKMKGAEYVIPQSPFRVYFGKGFTLLSKILLRMNISDFNCGFKCFSQQAADAVFPKATLKRWGLDCEVLYLGKKYGFKIKEVPIRWTDDRNSTVKFPRDIILSFKELATIVKNDLQGKY